MKVVAAKTHRIEVRCKRRKHINKFTNKHDKSSWVTLAIGGPEGSKQLVVIDEHPESRATGSQTNWMGPHSVRQIRARRPQPSGNRKESKVILINFISF